VRRTRRQHTGGELSREEAFRLLRSSVVLALADLERPTVAVTSAVPGEGKTTVCANLGRSMALAGKRVVVADLDIRNPDAHAQFGCTNDVGIVDVLEDRCTVTDALRYVELDGPAGRAGAGLYFLPRGRATEHPTEILGSSKLPRLLATLADQADVVLVDTAPVLPVADTLVIGRYVAGAILVVEERSTPVPTVERAKAALIRNQTRLLGVVLNRSEDVRFGYEYGPSVGDLPADASAGG
jgi:non-specific protein-tyrosine kinase